MFERRGVVAVVAMLGLITAGCGASPAIDGPVPSRVGMPSPRPAETRPERPTSPEPTAPSPAPSPTAAAGTDWPSALAPTPCPDDVTVGMASVVSCAWLKVVEDRSATGSRQIRLFVTRIMPSQPAAEDPMVLLGLDIPWTTDYPSIAPMADRIGRVVYVLDQRGSGHSEPSLRCTELEDLAAARLPLASSDPAATIDVAPRAATLAAVGACHDRLVASGVALASYDLVQSAADVEDLRVALEVDSVNLITHGTASRIAFEVLRRHPGHVRAVVLDTPSVPQVDMFSEGVLGTKASLDAVATACRGDAACDAAHPRLEAAIKSGLATMAAHPARVSGQGHALIVDDATSIRLTRIGLTDDDFLPFMPAAIDSLVADGLSTDGPAATALGHWPLLSLGYGGDSRPATGPDPDDITGDFSHGLLFTIACRNQLPFVMDTQLAEATAALPALGRAFLASPFGEVCRRWQVPADPSTHGAVTTSVPILVLLGRFDPVAAPSLVRPAIAGLTHGTIVELPDRTHNVLNQSDCGRSIRNAWIEDPMVGPDVSCVAAVRPIAWK